MRAIILFPFLLCGCLGPATINYAGTMVPTRGMCDLAGEASLTLRGSKAIFAPQSGALLLTGTAGQGAVRLAATLLDANKHPYALHFDGSMNGKTGSGVYQTPRCTYQVALKRTAG